MLGSWPSFNHIVLCMNYFEMLSHQHRNKQPNEMIRGKYYKVKIWWLAINQFATSAIKLDSAVKYYKVNRFF